MPDDRLQPLFDELGAALVLYARQWCDDPDDAVQEAFIDLSRTSPFPDFPKGWLFQATRRKAQNIARSESRRRTHQRKAGIGKPVATPPQQPTAANWFVPTAHTFWPSQDVIDCLNKLSTTHREILTARIWGELGFEEISKLMGCSVSSAHRRYRAALREMKSWLNTDISETENINLTPSQETATE